MSENTAIEWCDASLSPWWGCTKVSPACAHCYAEAIDARFAGGGHWGKGAPRLQKLNFERDALRLDRKAAKLGSKLTVFPSMCDPFDEEVSIEMFSCFLDVIRQTPNLIWLLLTKRPGNFRERMLGAIRLQLAVNGIAIGDAFDIAANRPDKPVAQMAGQWVRGTSPANVWIGTTVEDQTRMIERHLALMKIPARVHFWSGEPLLSAIDAKAAWAAHGAPDWVICGGESGPGARPMHPDWARSLRDQCAAAGAAFFFKQWGEWAQGHPSNPAIPRLAMGSGVIMGRFGKKLAGRRLDGREHNEFPKI
jgi:protein gp37